MNEARIVLANDLAEAAGRAAYLAAFHAAQAYIFDTTGKAAKTHTGLRSEFARLAKDELRLGRPLSTFLARAYTLKTVADYAIGDDVRITVDEASATIVEGNARPIGGGFPPSSIDDKNINQRLICAKRRAWYDSR